MIGTALSGVTFISVPGQVGSPDVQFKYFQFVLGNAIGFILIAKVLLPLYYRMNLTSIYGYIEQRLGYISYKTAASIFLISRTIGLSRKIILSRNCFATLCFDAFEYLLGDRLDFSRINFCLHLSRWTKNNYYYRYFADFVFSFFCNLHNLFYLRQLRLQYSSSF